MQKHSVLLLVALGLTAAACSSSAIEVAVRESAPKVAAPETPAPAPAGGENSAPITSSGSSAQEPSGPALQGRDTSELPVAADFTLALGDGGTFVLSEAAKPVYVVFWADW